MTSVDFNIKSIKLEAETYPDPAKHTIIKEEIVPKLRRTIGDTKKPYNYTDNALAEYIEDAMDTVSITWDHGYEIDRKSHVILDKVGGADQMLFVAQAKFDLKNTEPDISYKTGTISVTRKSTDKTRLKKIIDEMLTKKLLLESIGISSTEFDAYERRFEKILYY